MGEAAGGATGGRGRGRRSDFLDQAPNLTDLPGGGVTPGASAPSGGSGAPRAGGGQSTAQRQLTTRQTQPTDTAPGQPASRAQTQPRADESTQTSGRRKLRSGTLLTFGLASTSRKTLLGQ